MSDHAGGDGYEVGPPQWRHEVAAVLEGGGEVSSPSPMDWCWWGSMRLACKYSKTENFGRRSPPSALKKPFFLLLLLFIFPPVKCCPRDPSGRAFFTLNSSEFEDPHEVARRGCPLHDSTVMVKVVSLESRPHVFLSLFFFLLFFFAFPCFPLPISLSSLLFSFLAPLFFFLNVFLLK